MHMAQLQLAQGDKVLGFDNLNDYYDPALKRARLAQLLPLPGFRFVQPDVADHAALDALFAAEGITHVVHLAAQAGVRYLLQSPRACVQSNRVGFGNVLEVCRQHRLSTSCKTAPAACTAPTARCRFRSRTTWTTR